MHKTTPPPAMARRPSRHGSRPAADAPTAMAAVGAAGAAAARTAPQQREHGVEGAGEIARFWFLRERFLSKPLFLGRLPPCSAQPHQHTVKMGVSKRARRRPLSRGPRKMLRQQFPRLRA
jgi:hypothetical protein